MQLGCVVAMAELRWGSATDPGQLRPQNEDQYLATTGLFVVADGMGGHQAGEIASRLAIERMQERLTGEATMSDLVSAIGDANGDIFRAAIANSDQQGMGTTVTSLVVVSDPHDGEVFALANVGDSRTYLIRHGKLRQLTIDHSYVQELVAEGHINRDEARNHPRRNIVTRATRDRTGGEGRLVDVADRPWRPLRAVQRRSRRRSDRRRHRDRADRDGGSTARRRRAGSRRQRTGRARQHHGGRRRRARRPRST